MDTYKLKAIVKGLITFIPGVYEKHKDSKPKSGHSSSNAKFCYSLWLRILVSLDELNIDNKLSFVAELGPSHSFGVGLCALLCGAEKYIALDIENNYNPCLTQSIFEELIELFNKREPIPDDSIFPQINIRIKNYDFPEYIFTEDLLTQTLNENRLKQILSDIQRADIKHTQYISYYSPWQLQNNKLKIKEQNIDLVFSRAVLEHVDSPEKIYRDLNEITEINTLMIHDIEYHSHGLSKYWNGHMFFDKYIWKLIKGKRHYFINRCSHTEQEKLTSEYGFKIIHSERIIKQSVITKKKQGIPVNDLQTYGGVIVSKKR